MEKMGRREALKAGMVGAAASAVSAPQMAQAAETSASSALPAPSEQMDVKGQAFSPIPESNPLEAKIITFTTVSLDVEASIVFYRDVIGMTVLSDSSLPVGLTTAPGIGSTGRRHVLLTMPE